MFPASPAPAAFDIGRTLSRAVTVLGRNFAPFAVASAVLVGLPMLALGVFQSTAIRPDASNINTIGFAVAGLLFLPLSVVCGALLQSAVIYGAVNDWNGQRATLGATLAAAFNRVLPLIGVSILVGVLTFLAALLLIIPGILVALAYAVATPAVVMEPGRGVFGALTRSADLTRNKRWAIFIVLLVVLAAAMVLGMVTSGLSAVLGIGSPLVMMKVQMLAVRPLTQSITTLFGAVISASIYYELRTIKEGIGAEALASIFD